MADKNMPAEEVLLDVRVAEASKLYKFYLNQEKLILGTLSVSLFLLVWELVGNTFQLINPMFMSAPSLIWKAAVQLFGSGEIWNDLMVRASSSGGDISCRLLLASRLGSLSVGTRNSPISVIRSSTR
jgi:ABC-type nitrate/sulfonate/bicarbonate transport system permease component